MPQPPRKHRLCAAIALTLGGLVALPVAQADTVIPLSSLDGSNGFRLDGVADGDTSGFAIATAGDINGDDIDDLIVGAFRASPNGVDRAGSIYVVFGRTDGFDSAINLSTLDGSNGFRLDGVTQDDISGYAVSAAGDINGDGIDDLIIGAFRANPNGQDYAGSSYVVFGRSSGFESVISLSTLNGSNGFRLDGVAAYDYSGRVVSAAGDINGDGIDDIIIGAQGAGPNGLVYAGSSFVVFGRSSGFGSVINLSTLNGSNGFRLDGVAAGDRSGAAVSALGDINGDGVDDLIIGAYRANPNGMTNAGSSYVVFGRTTGFGSVINLSTLNGGSGFRVDGVAADDESGGAIAGAGDINGDGINDLIIGAGRANPNGLALAGSSYVLFGRTSSFGSIFNLSTLNGSNGFRLDGVAAGDFSGVAVAGAGDINGDGIDDLIIGAVGARPNGLTFAGSSYVVFGRTGSFDSTINLSTLSGNNGFRLDGVAAGDRSGAAVSAAGDINGDGIDDLIIGAASAAPNGIPFAGSSYVVFGRRSDAIFSNGFEVDSFAGTPGFYTNRTTFLENVQQGFFEDPYDDIVQGFGGALLQRTDGNYSYDISATGPGSNNLFNGTGFLSTQSPFDAIVITFTGAPVTAIGGNFWATNFDFVPTGGAIILTLSDGSTESYLPSSVASFGGFVAETPIISITIDAPESAINHWSAADNLIVGQR